MNRCQFIRVVRTLDVSQVKQVVARDECVPCHKLRLELLLKRVPKSADGPRSQGIGHSNPAGRPPGKNGLQSHQLSVSIRVQADRACGRPDIALEALIPDMRDDQTVSNLVGLSRRAISHGKEGRQLNLEELVDGFADRRHLLLQGPIATTVAWEMGRHHRHAPPRPLVQSANVSSTHLADPVRIATE